MRKVAISIALLLAIGPLTANALIIETVELDFASGAQWAGTITFNDGYEGMVDTEGYLTGGSHAFNEFFHWTWWDGTGQTNPNDLNSDGFYEDWLINGVEGGDYSIYIGLSWDATASLSGGLNFIDLSDPYYNGNVVYQDLITGYSVLSVSVPEPATLGLLGIGLVGFAYLRRKRQPSC